MSLIRINRNPSRRQLLGFGVCWLLFFGCLGAAAMRRSASLNVAAILWAAALVVPLIGWAFPKFMRLVYLGMAYLAFPIGFAVSHVILGIVYYAVLTPIGLVMRLFGYDPLKRPFDARAESYWVARKPSADPKRYFRQF
jgi:hypothetical protein